MKGTNDDDSAFCMCGQASINETWLMRAKGTNAVKGASYVSHVIPGARRSQLGIQNLVWLLRLSTSLCTTLLCCMPQLACGVAVITISLRPGKLLQCCRPVLVPYCMTRVGAARHSYHLPRCTHNHHPSITAITSGASLQCCSTAIQLNLQTPNHQRSRTSRTAARQGQAPKPSKLHLSTCSPQRGHPW